MLVRPMLLHRMALVSVRLFCKNLGYLQEWFTAPSGKKFPCAYDQGSTRQTESVSQRAGSPGCRQLNE